MRTFNQILLLSVLLQATVLLTACGSESSQSAQSKSTSVVANSSKKDEREGDFVNSSMYRALPQTSSLKENLRRQLKLHNPVLNLARAALYFDGERFTKDDFEPLSSPDAINYLQKLSLECLGISDVDLESVSQLRLRDIRVSNNPIADLHALSKMKSLAFIDLTGTNLNTKGMQVLSGLPELSGLRLNGTKIGDADLVYLYKLNNLTWLELQKCPNITKAGVDLFKHKVPKCRILMQGVWLN